MSLYLLAKKAKRDQMQRARNHRAPFSLFYTNMNSLLKINNKSVDLIYMLCRKTPYYC